MSDITSRFAELKNTRLNYVCLFGHEGLPVATPENSKPIVILTDAARTLCRVLELEENMLAKSIHKKMPITGIQPCNVMVLEKGKGAFPERWESLILQTHTTYQRGSIRVPTPDELVFTLLYWKLFREGWLMDLPEQRRAIANFVENRIGTPTAYDDDQLPHFA